VLFAAAGAAFPALRVKNRQFQGKIGTFGTKTQENCGNRAFFH
jgi:hypothetical protein